MNAQFKLTVELRTVDPIPTRWQSVRFTLDLISESLRLQFLSTPYSYSLTIYILGESYIIRSYTQMDWFPFSCQYLNIQLRIKGKFSADDDILFSPLHIQYFLFIQQEAHNYYI